MSEYVSAKDIPESPFQKNKYPWEEWGRTIPEGEALEITKELRGTTALSFSRRGAYAAVHGLKIARRGERIWLVKEKQP